MTIPLDVAKKIAAATFQEAVRMEVSVEPKWGTATCSSLRWSKIKITVAAPALRLKFELELYGVHHQTMKEWDQILSGDGKAWYGNVSMIPSIARNGEVYVLNAWTVGENQHRLEVPVDILEAPLRAALKTLEENGVFAAKVAGNEQ